MNITLLNGLGSGLDIGHLVHDVFCFYSPPFCFLSHMCVYPPVYWEGLWRDPTKTQAGMPLECLFGIKSCHITKCMPGETRIAGDCAASRGQINRQWTEGQIFRKSEDRLNIVDC